MNAQILRRIEPINLEEASIIDVDLPFDAKEVEEATCRRYVERLSRSDMPIVPARGPFVTAAERKSRAAMGTEHIFDPIDVDMPFSASEVAALTSEAYVAALGPSDLPIVRH